MTLNCLWWWGYGSGYLRSVEYAFIAFTPISTLTSAQSAEAVEYTDCIFAEGYDLPTKVLDMTRNNLMVRFQ